MGGGGDTKRGVSKGELMLEIVFTLAPIAIVSTLLAIAIILAGIRTVAGDRVDWWLDK